MSRKYTTMYSKIREIITYHVYEDGLWKQAFDGEKELAEEYAATLIGEVEIRKTRRQIDR